MSMNLSPQLKSHGDELFAGEPFLLHQFFDRAARQSPERTALEIPPGSGRPERRLVSYAELERQSDNLAGFLRTFVTGECVAAILLPRNTEHLYVSQLGVLKSGAAYTCLDPTFPDEQARDILDDSEAVVLLTDSAGLTRARRCGFGSVQAFDVAELLADTRNSIPAPTQPSWLTANSLAYVIYTSGTTGSPKGVMIEHGSIANLVRSDLEEFGLSAGDRIAQSSSPAYDSSVEEMWLGYAAGATLVVMDDETTRLGPDLVPWLRRERITVLCPPPTLLRASGCADPETALPDLSVVYVGGEALPADVADRWSRGRRLVNGYGPTECSVTAMRATIPEGEPVTIGRPIHGLRAWVLNESLEEVPDGRQGELCLGGVGLARGYRNRPELTAEKFPQHRRLGRIYRTGDLVHRVSDGRFFYHGRMDSQVKLRGYRVELEAIEWQLAECSGVREAACTVQGNNGQQTLVAFVVLENGHAALAFDDLKAALRSKFPQYMVPSRFAIVSNLPTTVGGKLNRSALPVIESSGRSENGKRVLPRNDMELKLEAAFSEVLRLPHGCSVHDDFFNDLGGDSLSAAELISLLREDPATSLVTARDLYGARTVAELASQTHPDLSEQPVIREDEVRQGNALLATAIQTAWLLATLVFASSLAYFAAFKALPYLISNLGVIPVLLLAPALLFGGLVVYAPVSVLVTTLTKRILVGRYRPLRAPVWGGFYIRNWIVQHTARLVPWSLFEGTVFEVAALRALGARIGRRVHIHRGVNLRQGGWDLLEIGDDVTIGQEASLRLVELDDGQMIVGAVSLGDRSTLDTRAGVGGNTRLEEETYLTALSSLPEGGCIPRGELWDGVPARPAGASPSRHSPPEAQRILTPLWHSIVTVAARLALMTAIGTSLMLPAILLALIFQLDKERALNWLSSPSLDASLVGAAILIVTLAMPLMLVVEAVIARMLGRVEAGVISRWSLAYVRVCLKTQLVDYAGKWLAGALLWPVWLRCAGMKIGRGAEISTIINVVPELIEIGRKSFLADGIYLGGPRIHRGAVTLANTVLGDNTFLGNHVIIAGGQHLPSDILLGVCTVADEEAVRPGSAWFGHPPFELPRREVIQYDRKLTFEPSLMLYANRVFWETLRVALPILPLLILPVWLKVLAHAQLNVSTPRMILVVAPLASLGTLSFFCLLVLALKWALLGRVRPGLHAFWSCWCNRWDFLYMAWEIYARGALSYLEGTLLLSSYLRAMGARIGRRVVLGGGFAQVVDPDMLDFEDGVTVSCHIQAHTFEDRVLKIDRVRIRRRATVESAAVLLYGADIGERTHVAPHSVVMKRESLLAGRSYVGVPTRPVQAMSVTAAAEA
ncbi:MAG TPA: amino acid adenylation domain-containing protein [Blastocatellia bacterium]|nr:amino acid adenylation domain-containing protein [Blastocatellia bacterium]